jgi:chromosome segregation ATPase
MSRFNKSLSILTVSFLGLWGCAQGPANSSAQADKVKKLEDKCAQKDEDYRKKAVELDQARKVAAGLQQDKEQLEDQRGRMQKELDQFRVVVKERDRLRQELDLKTTQRDALQARCDKLKAGIRSLMSDDDAMLPTPPTTNTATFGAAGH